MPSTATINADLSIAIPEELSEALQLVPGTTLLVERRGDVLEFRRALRTVADLAGLLSRYAPDTPVAVAEMNEAVATEASARHDRSGERR